MRFVREVILGSGDTTSKGKKDKWMLRKNSNEAAKHVLELLPDVSKEEKDFFSTAKKPSTATTTFKTLPAALEGFFAAHQAVQEKKVLVHYLKFGLDPMAVAPFLNPGRLVYVEDFYGASSASASTSTST